MMFEVLFLPLGLVYLLVFVFVIADFIYYVTSGRRKVVLKWPVMGYIVVLFTGLMPLFSDLGVTNDCCGGWAFLSPSHRLSVYVVLALGTYAYFYCAHRTKLASPVMEIIVNCLLLTEVVLYIFFCIQMDETWLWLICPLPAILLFVMILAKNHQRVMEEIEREPPLSANGVVQFCWFLLQQKAWTKFPALLVLCLPLLVCVAAILLLFGQKPDSLVRAFTDTYKQGLSQLDIDCNKVVCGGHFLCTIAAKGHPGLVRPVRAGIRGGAPIKCSRQLLIANAFEEWLEQHMPALHRPVRRLYDHVGSCLHRHYGVFDRKWVSDLVYLLMKPLEWIFLLTLYMVDRRPENRIAQQYMHWEDRDKIKMILNKTGQ